MDILNLDEEILMKIYQRVQDFLPAAQRLLTEKTDIAVVSAQEKLNAVWDVVFTLPGYRDLQIDRECSYHALENLLTESDKWMQIQTPGTEGYTMYQEFMEGLSSLAARIRMFQGQIATMTEFYFEPLTRRNSAAYADAYSKFYSQMASIAAHYFNEDFDQSFPVEVSFVPMMHPTEEGKVFVAEKTTFNNLLDFLRTEFYRGLAIGNAPRPLPQLRQVFFADRRLQHLLLQQHCAGRDGAHLPEGGRSPKGGAGQGQPHACPGGV